MPTRIVNAYPKSKCLPGEHKRPESTGARRVFFVNHAKEEYMHTRKVNAYPESTSTRTAHAGAWNFF